MSALGDRIQQGDVGALARACRLVDERVPGHRELLMELFAASGRARCIGITGAPGVGKSTLTDGLIGALRARGERVAVIAVDPSSPFSGGALLGDRIRMQRHAGDAEVFIRSLATRGVYGGLSRSAGDVLRLLEAWGASTVLVETVGVGQSEFELLGVVDTVLLVVMPGAGDDVQANKAGLLEAADILVLNKADRPEVDNAELDLRASIALSGAPSGGWSSPILRTIAARGEGIESVLAACDAHASWSSSEAGQARRGERERRRLLGFLRESIADAVVHRLRDQVDALLPRLVERSLDPYRASELLLAEFRVASDEA